MFCDVCGKEGEKGSGGSTFAGILSRLNVNLEKQAYRFAQDLCSECSELVLKFIDELKNDVKTRGANSKAEHGGKGNPGKK